LTLVNAEAGRPGFAATATRGTIMTRPVTRKITRDVKDAASDIQDTLKKAGGRLGEDAHDALTETAGRLTVAARDIAVQARSGSKVVAARVVREAKARPFAAGAILAGVAALIGLAIARARGRSA
jgi:hypothetical protein